VLFSLVLGVGLAPLSAADVHTFSLPDLLTLPLAGVGLLMAWLMGWAPLWWRGLSAAVAFLLLFAVEQAYRGCGVAADWGAAMRSFLPLPALGSAPRVWRTFSYGLPGVPS
jgi:leader peptidase (prepilin peptidase)/N-methyltransferase